MKNHRLPVWKTVVARVMVVIMLIVLITPSTTMSAAATTATPKLTKTSADILEKGSLDLNIKSKIRNSTYTWSTSNKKIATVDKMGVVKGVKQGTAVITCSVKAPTKTYKLTCKVSIRKAATSIEINNKVTALNLGQSYNLNITRKPSASNDPITWAVSNKKIAVPDKNGKFTALKTGTVKLTAKTLGGKRDSVTIRVVDKDGTVTTQEELTALLGSGASLITIKTDAAIDFTIPRGTYKKTALVVDAPNSEVHNNGIFASVTIKDVKAGVTPTPTEEKPTATPVPGTDNNTGGNTGGNGSSDTVSVTFMDGSRTIEALTATKGKALGRAPGADKMAKANAVFVGWFTDSGFTTPFYYDAPVDNNTTVYAKYEEMSPAEELTLTSFAQLDQTPDLVFEVVGSGSEEDVLSAVTLIPKDGSDVIPLVIKSTSNGVYTIGANGGFHPGASYELTLADGYSFKDKPASVRTASFSIAMAEVQNLEMSDDIIYIQDTSSTDYKISGTTYEVLTPSLVTDVEGTFTYWDAASLEAGDILCFYKETSPKDRDYTANSYTDDPEVYVKVKSISSTTVTFVAFGNEADMPSLYKVPDSFPLLADILPTGDTGTINISALDTETYQEIYGEDYILDTAKAAISSGDFVLIYVPTEGGEEGDTYYGEVTAYNKVTGEIAYKATTEEAIEHCMDLFITPEVVGEDLITDEEKEALEEKLLAQVEASNFANDAAYMLADMATQTDGFRTVPGVETLVVKDQTGKILTSNEIQSLSLGSSFELTDKVKLTVELVTKGDQLHFKNEGVQLAIGVDATFEVKTDDGGKIAIDLSAVFVEEVALDITVTGKAVKKWKIPIGVKVSASIDIKNYTALSINVNIYSVAPEEKDTWTKVKGLLADTQVGELLDQIEEVQNKIDQAKGTAEQLYGYAQDLEKLWDKMPKNKTDKKEWAELGKALGKTSITKDLMGMLDLTTDTSLEAGKYAKSMQDLLDKYSKMIQQETDWIKIVDKEIISFEACYFGIAIGASASFVVRANVNIAMGTSLEYEVGKRYTFWFKIGLFKPSGGSSTMDLIDEKFAFQFYVMGQVGLKMGVAASFKVGLLSTKFASIGITAEVGPYVRLYGFFIYEYERTRPKNTNSWIYDERMAGALYFEFGLYTIISFEAQALVVFEYSKELINEEFPLLTAGKSQFKYAFANKPADGEKVRITDEDGKSSNGITMLMPDSLRALSYLDLKTGNFGSDSYDYKNYNVTLSNPNFSFDKATGKVTVTVPARVQYMECDLMLTWLQDKLAFNNQDITVTIPLVWTNLSNAELKEYFTASVRIGNAIDGYQTVWSKRVMKNQPFDLPAVDTIKALLNDDSGMKFARVSGYGGQAVENLTIYTDTVYTIDAEYKVYSVTVSGIKNADGTTTSKAYTAKYGGTFDFSDLAGTGTNIPGEEYTRFNGLEMSEYDMKAPITGSYARAILEGKVNPAASYVDDTVAATFQFVGLLREDIVRKLKKGQAPDISELYTVAGENGVDIIGISPADGKIFANTVYTVTCGKSEAPEVTITFNEMGGSEVQDITRKAGSPITLPEPTKTGNTFAGWYYYVGQAATKFTEAVMPSENITLTAYYTPIDYTVTLNATDGTFEDGSTKTITVRYDYKYNYLLGGSSLPTPTQAGNATFAGWVTSVSGGALVTNDTLVKTAADHTLYAHWSDKTVIDGDAVTLIPPSNLCYDGQAKVVTVVSGSALFAVQYKRVDDTAWRDNAIYPGEYDVKVSLKPEYSTQYAPFEKNFAAVFTITELPYSIKSSDGYTYKVVVHTADEKYAGTDAKLYAALYSDYFTLVSKVLTNTEQFRIDGVKGNNFERNDTDTCVLQAADALALADVDLRLWWVKSGTNPGWKCDWIEVQLWKGNALVATSGEIKVNQWFEEEGRTDFYTTIKFKRTITDVGNFTEEGTIEVDKDITPYVFTYDGVVTDGILGTYNAFAYAGAPNLEYVVNVGQGYSDETKAAVRNCINVDIDTVAVDTTQLNNLMDTANMGYIELNVTLSFSGWVTDASKVWHKKINIFNRNLVQ
jgi:hypothetical protein